MLVNLKSVPLAAACFAALALSASANAASINYGNFGPNGAGVTFLGVTESSGTDPVPLFGAPTLTLAGLDFDPTSFVAAASGGSADTTDGQLNFTVKNPAGLSSISLAESGDYSLVGTGTAATKDFAGAIMQISVTEVNGVPVVPFNLPPVNASVGFNLLANPGVVQPWSLGVTATIPTATKITGIKVTIDNQLIALSETGSVAFIAKKDFTITTGNTPEPATLAAGALSMVFLRRRR